MSLSWPSVVKCFWYIPPYPTWPRNGKLTHPTNNLRKNSHNHNCTYNLIVRNIMSINNVVMWRCGYAARDSVSPAGGGRRSRTNYGITCHGKTRRHPPDASQPLGVSRCCAATLAIDQTQKFSSLWRSVMGLLNLSCSSIFFYLSTVTRSIYCSFGPPLLLPWRLLYYHRQCPHSQINLLFSFDFLFMINHFPLSDFEQE